LTAIERETKVGSAAQGAIHISPSLPCLPILLSRKKQQARIAQSGPLPPRIQQNPNLAQITNLLPPRLLGTAAGVAISAVDSFLVDKLVKGWKPHQFIESDLVSRFDPSQMRKGS
jgi:hypothetical protein